MLIWPLLHYLLLLSTLSVSLQIAMDTTHDAAVLERFQVETDEWINKTIDSLGWTRESLLKVITRIPGSTF